MNALVRGGLAGIGGTGAMTAVMAARRMAGLRRLPPQVITEGVTQKAGLRSDLPEPVFNLGWLAAHFGFGSSTGAGYALARRFLPKHAFFAGLLWGSAVYAVSYLGLMPGLGLYPEPRADARTRTLALIVAHAVFGVTTAELERMLAGTQ
jgi:hypothetical protein